MIRYAVPALAAVFIIHHPLCSQEQHLIDSVMNVVGANYEDRYSLLHGLAAKYVDVDNERALTITRKAEAIALASGDSVFILKSQRLKGQILFKLGQPHAVISIIQPLLQNSNIEDLGDEYLSLVNLLGVCHLTIGEFDKALENYFQTKVRAEEVGDREYAAISSKNIGIAYYKLKDYRKALSFMTESYQIEQSLDAQNFATPMNISLCYTHLGDYNNARKFLRESMLICGDDCGVLPSVHIKYASGCVFFGLKQYAEAEADFLESSVFSKQIGDYRMQLDNIYMLAKIGIQTKDFSKAQTYLKEGESLINIGTPFNLEMIKVYSQLSDLYLRIHNFERASFYQSRYIKLKDSVYNEAVTTNLMKIESRYLQKENEAKIAAQDEIISLKEETLYRQSVLNVVTILFGLTVTTLGIFLFKSYRLKKNMNRLLEEKIKQRTNELEFKVGSLMNVLHEREIEFNRFTSIVLETTNSLEGLLLVRLAETSGSDVNAYDRTFQQTIARLNETTKTFAWKSWK